MRARGGGGGVGYAVPSLGRFFVSCIIRACARAHAHTCESARAQASASEKMCIRGYARVYVCVCVYIASLVSRAYELGGHQK